MKKYIFFPTYTADWSLDPQYVLCGNPRIVILTPTSSASTFFWEQIQPNPLTDPITFFPNNTSKNVSIVIPNTITTNIRLRVTLNGDTSNYKYVDVIPLIVDNIKGISRASGFQYSSNTLNDAVPLILAPYPPAGPQVIKYVDNTQSTGVRLLSQSYRQGHTESIDVSDINNNFITNVPVFRNIYDFTPENRINIKVNTNYNLLKNWVNVKVFSQEITPIQEAVSVAYPTFIADDYSKDIVRGSGLLGFYTVPYLVQAQSLQESIPNNFTRGSGLLGYYTVPYLVQTLSLTDNTTNNFTRGSGYMQYGRTPYSSNIIG